jgi:hypothetical protein
MGFISIRTTSVAVLLLLAACVSCSRKPYDALATIAKFLNASPETNVWVSYTADEYGYYMLIYPQDMKRGVILVMDEDPKAGNREFLVVRNIGYGLAAGDDDWSLWNHDKDGTIYESQSGGLWTLRHFAGLLTEGLKKQEFRRIRFREIGPLRFEL